MLKFLKWVLLAVGSVGLISGFAVMVYVLQTPLSQLVALASARQSAEVPDPRVLFGVTCGILVLSGVIMGVGFGLPSFTKTEICRAIVAEDAQRCALEVEPAYVAMLTADAVRGTMSAQLDAEEAAQLAAEPQSSAAIIPVPGQLEPNAESEATPGVVAGDDLEGDDEIPTARLARGRVTNSEMAIAGEGEDSAAASDPTHPIPPRPTSPVVSTVPTGENTPCVENEKIDQ